MVSTVPGKRNFTGTSCPGHMGVAVVTCIPPVLKSWATMVRLGPNVSMGMAVVTLVFRRFSKNGCIALIVVAQL